MLLGGVGQWMRKGVRVRLGNAHARCPGEACTGVFEAVHRAGCPIQAPLLLHGFAGARAASKFAFVAALRSRAETCARP
eukprot:1082908-Alexandrium_andersonii.AAC.1